MILILGLLLAVVQPSAGTLKETVDLIELNHFHDCLGRHVYDQVIFYEWSPEKSVYNVRAWCLVEDREIISRRPFRSYSDGRWHVKWQDRDEQLTREVSSENFRETWTHFDPERLNKKTHDERFRTSLIKRRLPKPAIGWTEETNDNQFEEVLP